MTGHDSSLEVTTSLFDTAESSQRVKEFRQAREMPAATIEFLENRQKDWKHGVPSTLSLITYKTLSSSEKGPGDEAYFVPDFTLSDIGSGESTRHSSLDVSNCPGAQKQQENTGAPLQSDHFESPFSGLLHVPSFSFTRPENVKSYADLSQFILQSHFEVGEVTYFFGGLQSDPTRAMISLGIPRSTDPSLISVYFPYDMPPYVNKDVLMSPFIIRNPSFYLFNPTRSTVHDYSKPCLDDFEPGHICDMKGTQISDFQVFFCGGFKVNIDKVEFDKNAGRWVIEKSISTNDNGFIMDVRRLSFTKISLLSRLGLNYRGRLGAAICSNFTVERPGHEATSFVSPLLTSANADASSFSSGTYSRRAESLSVALSPTTPVSFAPLNASQSPIKQEFENRRSTPSLKINTSKQPTNSISTKGSKDLKTHRISGENGHIVRTASPLAYSGRVPKDAIFPKNTEINPTNSSDDTHSDHKMFVRPDLKPDSISSETLAASNHKVPTMIAKSSRFFHRNLLKHKSATSQHQHTHQKKNLKRRTSKSLLATQESPKTCPQPDYKELSIATIDSNDLERTQSSTSSNSRAKSSANEKECLEISQSTKINEAHHTSRKTVRDVFESSEDLEQSLIFHNPGSKKSDQKSGISSICVYLFGGFVLKKNPEGHRAFQATNDMLKLELILNDSAGSDFHQEALIDTICPRDGIVPGPRGYFAHILTFSNLSNEVCNILGPERKNRKKPDHLDVYSSDTDVLSHSDKSTKTDSLDQSSSSIENMQLIIHGGVDSEYQVYGDLFIFDFEKECWIPLDTYAFDYYELPKKPYEDERIDKLQLDAQVENAKLVDAELRCCHHKAMVYWEGDKEYVAFVGGFNNDFLRHFDRTPYESLKFDVSRLAKLLVSCMNSNLLRIPVLNLRSQVWKFKRYFYDLTELAKLDFVELLKHDCMRNSSLAFNGGGILIVGKQLTICHGLVQFVPGKASDFEIIQKLLKNSSVLLGGHFHLTFPESSKDCLSTSILITQRNHKMFGLGGSPQISSQQKILAAEAELDMVTGMFNSLVEQCHSKCINKSYAEGDVNKQEALCLDRCVSKYFETNVQVGENMQKLGQSGQFMGR